MRLSIILALALLVLAVVAPVAIATDVWPPSQVTDLAVGGLGYTTMTLNFSDAGNDCKEGTAASYEVRYSTAPITESNYSSATILTSSGTPAGSYGTRDCYSVSGLQCGHTYYFAITFADASGNRAPASNSPSGTTRACNGPHTEVLCD